jgi:hypothetical protein
LKLPLKNEYQLAFFVFMCFVSFSSPVWAKGISDIAWHHLPSDSQELLCWRFNWSFLALVSYYSPTLYSLQNYPLPHVWPTSVDTSLYILLSSYISLFEFPYLLCFNNYFFVWIVCLHFLFLPYCLFVNRRLMPCARRFLVK